MNAKFCVLHVPLVLCALILAQAASAGIEIFNPVNKTYEISSGTAKMRAIIDYNISGPASDAWLTLGDSLLSIRKENYIEYFEMNNSDYNGNYHLNSNVYNRFTYTFTAEPSGKGEVHIYLLNNDTQPNASLIDIFYTRGAGAGAWSCLSNGAYRKLADAYDSTKYLFKVAGRHDGQYFTKYIVSINGQKKADCLIAKDSLRHLNKIEVVAKDTGIYLSSQRVVAGSYYVELPAGSHVLKLFANNSGDISSKLVSFSVIRSGNASYSFCPDNTAEGSCSAAKPKYCYKAALIDNCQLCGCSPGGVCSSNGMCELAATTTATAAATTTTATTATTGKVVAITAPGKPATTSTTAAAQEPEESSVGKYYIFIIILVAFFVVVVYLLRKDMEELG